MTLSNITLPAYYPLNIRLYLAKVFSNAELGEAEQMALAVPRFVATTFRFVVTHKQVKSVATFRTKSSLLYGR